MFIKNIVIILICGALSECKRPHYMSTRLIVTQCLKASGTTIDVAKSMASGDFSVQDENAKCFTKCFAVKKGFFDEDLNVNRKKVQTYLSKLESDPEKQMKIMDICIKSSDDVNPCDYAFESFQCFWTEIKKTPSRIIRIHPDLTFLLTEKDDK